MNKNLFDSLSSLFNKHGFRLYMIGGTSRDYLLGINSNDYDFVSDATPNEIATFIDGVDLTFAKYGTVKLKIEGNKVDIATFRIESRYEDYRHPASIAFTRSIECDYVRRDFTINAIYIDEQYKIIDFCGGVYDLKHKLIRFIGEPTTRINEDPLRIVRAERFAKRLNFEIEKQSAIAIESLRYLLEKINPAKLKEEYKKR